MSLTKPGACPSHRVDLHEDHFLAIVDHLVGDFLVAEGDELADRSFAGAKLVAHDQNAPGDCRRARNRLDDTQLAALDALGDGHLTLAREQWHCPHFAEVHPHRVVRLVERARREIELRLVARAITIEILVATIRLVGINNFDAGAPEGR